MSALPALTINQMILNRSFILLLSLTAGCNLFTTRAPEEPNPGSGGWQFPQSPQIAVENLESSVGRRSAVDYMRCFESGEGNDTLAFIPDPQSDALKPGLFDDWGLEKERRHVESLFANLSLDSVADLHLTVERLTLLADSSDLTGSYRLYLGHSRDLAPREMEGRLEFRLHRGPDGGWYIDRWTDTRNGEMDCWSDLKMYFKGL
ncbi:MAG: hypothetical protein V2A61_07165 [Calditrichota bacterium]